jgi:hypothetical protein
MEGAAAEARQAAISDGAADMTKDEKMLELSMKNFIRITAWVSARLIAAGILNPTFEDGSFHWSTKKECEDVAALSQSMSIVLGIVSGPIALIPAAALSGFGHHGWTLNRRESTGY